MIEIDEKKQIERAAMLADTAPAEKLDTRRAHSFVAEQLSRDAQQRRGFLDWLLGNRAVAIGISAVALAGLALFFVITPRGTGSDGLGGSPAELMEMTSIHATEVVADSTITTQEDSAIVIKEISE